jgi:hypothetical protein
VTRDLLGEADDLERRLRTLGFRPEADAPTPGAASAHEVAGAIEQVRHLVEGLAELQGDLQALRALKERLDRPRSPRVVDR